MTFDDWLDVLGLEAAPSSSARKQAAPGQRRDLGEVYRALQLMTPSRFEEVVAEVFRHMGYANARVVGGAYDGGVDVRASRSAPGGSEEIVIQCKRKGEVGPGPARELLGSVTSDPRMSRGFLVVSGKLSRACRDFIKEHGNLAALEGLQIAKCVIEYGVEID